ncbi:uncharacterized protein J3D65DRAFT_377451 [Phyllosticta citribraziliensis]|uniref:Secreted protein n=1 Tax=Phyllosticta citribraziliensis TaxID=989973 RepID=A0ABR1LQ97_9PEZI
MEEWQESARPWLCSHVMAASLLVALCVRAERVTRDVNPMLEYQLNTWDLDRRQLVCFILPVSRLPRDLRAGPGRKQGILVPCFVAMDSPTGPTVEKKPFRCRGMRYTSGPWTCATSFAQSLLGCRARTTSLLESNLASPMHDARDPPLSFGHQKFLPVLLSRSAGHPSALRCII